MTESWDGLPEPTNPTLLREAGWCKTCRFGPVPGSSLYCPDCNRSGYEWRLSEQRELLGTPRRDRPIVEVSTASQETIEKIRRVSAQVVAKAARSSYRPDKANPPCATRKQRRKARFSPENDPTMGP